MPSDNTEGSAIKRRTVLKAMGVASASTAVSMTGAASAHSRGRGRGRGFNLRILSSEPHQVSGGDALIEVALPRGIDRDDVSVLQDGEEITEAFALDPGTHALIGVVDGLGEPDDRDAQEIELAVENRQGTVTRKTIVNHPIEGPMFSGPQQHPFACNTEEPYLDAVEALGQPNVDNDEGIGIPVYEEENGDKTDEIVGYSRFCHVDPRVDFVYKSDDNGEFRELGPEEPLPDDVAYTTTTEGDEVPYVVRIEVGTINRWIYTLSALTDPEKRSTDLEDPDDSVWNGKLVYSFQGGTGIGYTQGSTSESTLLYEPGLSQGYAVAYSVGTKTGESYNLEVGGETAVMVKERFITRYGEPEFTIGRGGSGGAVQQYVYAQNHPGLLDGLIPIASFPDMITQTIHVGDCEPLEFYMDISDSENDKWYDDWNNRQWLLGLNATEDLDHSFAGAPTPRVREGTTECAESWRGHLPRVLNPHWGVHRVDGREHFEDVTETFRDVKFTHWDDSVNVYGENEYGYANRTWDNVGVQYGLRALREGNLTKAEFLDLNASVGGWKQTREFVPAAEPWHSAVAAAHPWLDPPEPWHEQLGVWDEWSARNMTHSPLGGDGDDGAGDDAPAPRTRGSLEAIQAAYESGFVNQGQIDIPILDWRQWLEPVLDQHNSHQSFAARQRLIEGKGNARNHLIWFVDGEGSVETRALEVMDAWLENIQANPDRNVATAKPRRAVDACFDSDGNVISQGDDAWDGILDEKEPGPCTAHEKFEVYSQSRYQAGGPITGDIFKCQLKSVEKALRDGTYGDVTFTDEEVERLNEIFPHGVCDFTKPDAGEPHPSGVPRGVWDSVAAHDERVTKRELDAAAEAHEQGGELEHLDRPITAEELAALREWANA